jgi:hypothetical protein
MTKMNVHQVVQRAAIAALSSGELPGRGLPAGVRALDLWRYHRFGSVLFRAEPNSGLYPFGLAGLHCEDAKWRPLTHRWVTTDGGGVGLHEPFDELVANDGPPGLHRLGGSSSPEVRLTMGWVTSDADAIQLTNRQATWRQPIGIDRFVLLGITAEEPATHATAVDHDERPLGGSLVL